MLEWTFALNFKEIQIFQQIKNELSPPNNIVRRIFTSFAGFDVAASDVIATCDQTNRRTVGRRALRRLRNQALAMEDLLSDTSSLLKGFSVRWRQRFELEEKAAAELKQLESEWRILQTNWISNRSVLMYFHKADFVSIPFKLLFAVLLIALRF